MSKSVKTYSGKHLNVTYEVERCMHAAECVNSGLRSVFDNTTRPWVQPDGAEAAAVMAVVDRCPSGALKYQLHDQPQTSPETNRITPLPNSALGVRGDITLHDESGDAAEKTQRLTLCRCGKSKNKPYCDYSHHAAGFRDDGTLGQAKLEAHFDDCTGPLAVHPVKDGPLKIEGKLSVYKADNTQRMFGNKVFLCRCGQSKNKPFCDGSHSAASFKSNDE